MKKPTILMFLFLAIAAYAQTNGTPTPPALPGDPKDWTIVGHFWSEILVFLMAVGRIVTAFRNGTGFMGAISGILGGTNQPKPPTP